MPREATERPRWQVVRAEVIRAALAALPPDEQEEHRLAKIAARKRSKARNDADKSQIHLTCSRLFEGDTLEEIAAVIGISPSRFRSWCAKWGIPISTRAGFRRTPLAWISNDNFGALTRLADDIGVSRAEAFRMVLAAALVDDAHVARRTLGIRRAAR